MEPMKVVVWAMCFGLAWLVFASLTGADEWLRSLFGTSKSKALEEKISTLESRIEEPEKQR